MARVLAFIPDLLFGSNVVAALQAAGHRVELAAELPDLDPFDLLIVDLTAEADERIEQVARVRPPAVPVLGFYSHVEADVRRRAERAGFDLVIPRSRMAREGAALAERLVGHGVDQ
jgi:DNA-binding NarL/FixJ family response regulator